jgi:hypothetical protein
MITFILENMSEDMFAEVNNQSFSRYPNDVKISQIKATRTTKLCFVDLGTLTGIASLIGACIGLCLQVRNNLKERSWNPEKLRHVLEHEMLKLGVTHYKVLSIDNYQSLVDSNKTPCVVRLEGDTMDAFQLYIFFDGKTYSMRTSEIMK